MSEITNKEEILDDNYYPAEEEEGSALLRGNQDLPKMEGDRKQLRKIFQNPTSQVQAPEAVWIKEEPDSEEETDLLEGALEENLKTEELDIKSEYPCTEILDRTDTSPPSPEKQWMEQDRSGPSPEQPPLLLILQVVNPEQQSGAGCSNSVQQNSSAPPTAGQLIQDTNSNSMGLQEKDGPFGDQKGVLNKEYVLAPAPNPPNEAKTWIPKLSRKQVQCEMCNQCFKNDQELRRHALRHRKPSHTCSECNLTFRYRKQLDKHEVQHTGVGKYRCENCDKAFVLFGSLRRHMKTHTGEHPFECDICGLRFTEKGHLNTHVRRHSGERRYRCTECGRTFNHGGSFKNHMRRHTGDRPHSCEFCEKTFFEKSQLVVHTRVHTKEHPFGCGVCGKTFARKESLKLHMRRHVGNTSLVQS